MVRYLLYHHALSPTYPQVFLSTCVMYTRVDIPIHVTQSSDDIFIIDTHWCNIAKYHIVSDR
jgi:hypothetical protein